MRDSLSNLLGLFLETSSTKRQNVGLSLLLCICLLSTVSCGPSEEPEPPNLASVSTNAPSAITQTSAASGGSISDDGGAAITARGVVFSTTLNPTVSDNKTTNGSGLGSFTSTINGLTANTQYYLRAYATNSVGTAYGNLVEFTTLSTTASLTTLTVNEITINSMMVGGEITDDGGEEVTERGVCWSTNPNPTIAGSNRASGSGAGTFELEITGLTPNTNYYIRAYATNSNGTSYGNQLEARTANQLPGPPPPPPSGGG